MGKAKPAAVVGVGFGTIGVNTGKDLVALAAEAVQAALADAGLERDQLDGLMVNRGPDVDSVTHYLGLQADYTGQTWGHARLAVPVLEWAAMAVNSGQAKYVACLYANTAEFSRINSSLELARATGGSHGELPYYGLVSPAGGAALATQRYFQLYGATSEDLATVVVTQHENATKNPHALVKKAISREEYLAAPYKLEPLRTPDYYKVADCAACIIVTTAERAQNRAKMPVYIRGIQGLRSGSKQYIFARPGLGIYEQESSSRYKQERMPVFDRAGVEPNDIDALMIYDSFSSQVFFALEEFGFCGLGEAASWVQGGRISVGGELPINTHGGHISEAMIGGWNHMIEAIKQIRGECGGRQVKNAELTQFVMNTGTAVIFGKDWE